MEAVGPECTQWCRSQAHASNIIAAIVRGAEEVAVSYIKQLCCRPGQVSDAEGRTPLHVAAAKGRRRVAEWLVKHKKAVVNQRDLESGYTPLHRSLFYGQIDVAVSLVQMGANMQMMDKEDFTPLDLIMKSLPPIVASTNSGPSEAYVWGTNANFNLGIGNQQSKAVPEPVEFLRRNNICIKTVGLNVYHSVFVSDSGRVYSCGHGQGGRLGQDSEKPSLVPLQMKLPSTDICCDVAVGVDHTLLLLENGNVLSCGSNEHFQLGQSGNPPPKFLLQPRCMGMKNLPLKKVLGICAGRFHSVLWSDKGVATCGLNAGQLGHVNQNKEPMVMTPKLVMAPALQFKDDDENSIVLVASSDAAIVVALKKGTICVIHKYKCKKIAYRISNVAKIAVTGGHLDTDVEHNNEELTVSLLTTIGKILIWHQSTQQMSSCEMQLKRQLIISDFALTNNTILFTTADKEAYEGFFKQKKKTGDLECQTVRLKRLPNIHRAVAVSCDPRGRNFSIIQIHPKTALLEVPQMDSSDMKDQMKLLLDEVCEEDMIHDVVFVVGLRRFCAHQCIVSSRSEALAVIIQEQKLKSDDEVVEIVLSDVPAEVFKQFLKYIYTDTCDLLVTGPCDIKLDFEQKKDVVIKKEKSATPERNYDLKAASAFQVYQSDQYNGGKKKKSKNPAKPLDNDPLKMVASLARLYGLPNLSKTLNSFQYKCGVICVKSGHDVPIKRQGVSFDRASMSNSCDATVLSLEGDEMHAHRCILAARLEYFNSMFAHGWAESKRSCVLKMALSTDILDNLLDFIYYDEAPKVFADTELAKSMLVVADQMLIGRLKEACECALAASITLKNAAELMQFAATYNAPQLKVCCMQFISFNLPAFIEAKSLDEVEWEVLEELTKYHRDITPAMQCRLITPYAHGPSSEELDSIASQFPLSLDQLLLPLATDNEDFEIKKQRLKAKKFRTRRISSEGNTNRKDSVCSNASEPDEFKEEIAPMEEDICAIPAIDIAEPVLVVESQCKPKAQPASIWDDMFPVLENSLSNLELAKSKIKPSEPRKITKLSQKQRRKISESEKEPTTPTSPPPRSTFGWGKSGEVELSSPSLQDIIKEESKKAWARSPEESARAIPIVKQPIIVPTAQSPPAAWAFSSSPGGSASLSSIVRDEKQQKVNLGRVVSKPLVLTQIEDRACQELLAFYMADEARDECISVRRVEGGAVATPTWVSSHSNR